MQILCRFASREALLAACPAAWRQPDADPAPPPAEGALVLLGVLWDRPDTDYDAEGRPLVPPVQRPGFHALLQLRSEPPEGFAAAQVAWQSGDPVIPGEDAPLPPLDPGVVPEEITRAQARVVMAAHILPDGRSLLRAMRELLAAQQDATAELPDADPRKIAATQAAEWWTAAATYRRNHTVLLMAAAALGIPDAVVDALFRAAAALAAG